MKIQWERFELPNPPFGYANGLSQKNVTAAEQKSASKKE